MTEPSVARIAPVYFAQLPAAEQTVAAVAAAFAREKDADDLKRTHMFGGRFENIYIPLERLPELVPVSEFMLRAAGEILGRDRLRQGFWFNEMHPGHRTTLHSHEEEDELLSAVCYLLCPQDSGRLILHDDAARIVVDPRPGLMVLFPPDLPHEVEENTGSGTRLSVAFNFGPPQQAT